MGVTVSSPWNVSIQSLFEQDTNRYIVGANSYITDNSSSLALSASYVSLSVKDSNNTTQYSLDANTSPYINFDPTSKQYSVDKIDVTAFPSGKINLIWDFNYSGSDYILSQSVTLDKVQPITIISNASFTRQDGRITLGQAKTFSIKIQDALGNPADMDQARLTIYDGLRGSLTYYSASLYAAGTGMYSVTHTWGIGDLFPDINRYNIWWDANLYGSWFSVYNSQMQLQVYFPSVTNIQCAPITYSTNQDIRDTFIGISELLSKFNRKPQEIEITLNNKRVLASHTIERMIQANPKILNNPQLIKDLEMHLVWRAIIVESSQFAKFENYKDLLSEIDHTINQIKWVLCGPVGCFRITN
jgi:hypothetical protein